ncbi:MAG: FG-GAP-like repeat-containing protein, partial [Planctomycetota bacterium]
GAVGSHINTALLNDGNGVFAYSDESTGLGARGVALGDLDGDGDLDVFLAMAGGPSVPLAHRVLQNDGSGSFTDTGQGLGGSYSDMVALADLDGDGDLDALVANDDLFDNDPANTVWINDGSGFFADSGQRLGNARSTDVDLADVDDDGDIDALVTNPNAPDDLWLNDGNGFFTNSGQAIGGAEQSLQAGLGDLDGDGDPDAFVITGGSGDRVYLNADAEPICPGDINGDGVTNVLDLIDLLLCFGLPAVPDCEAQDVNSDGTVNVLDLIDLLLAFGTGCP